MAPIVVKGKVIVGSSGGEMGVRGWIAALDAATAADPRTTWRVAGAVEATRYEVAGL